LTQDQGFNSQDAKSTQQNLDFGTFKDQQSATQTSTSQQSTTSPKANNQQTQQGTTQNPASNSNNPNSRSAEPALVPAKKEQPKILLAEVQKPVLGKGLKINQGISYQRLHVAKL